LISLKHGGGNILPDGTMLIMSVTEENVICPQHISGKIEQKFQNRKFSKNVIFHLLSGTVSDGPDGPGRSQTVPVGPLKRVV